jgi:hypothetical protein
MPIMNAWSRLTPDTVENIPEEPGVYELATLVRNTLFIGRSAERTLRGCLHDELSGRASMIRQQPLYVRYEPTAKDDQRHRELVDEYRRAHAGKLPPLNQHHAVPESPRAMIRRAGLGGRAQLRVVS